MSQKVVPATGVSDSGHGTCSVQERTLLNNGDLAPNPIVPSSGQGVYSGTSELEDSAPPAPAAPIAAPPVVGPAKSGGASPHARPVVSAREPRERNRRETEIQKHILEPEYCPFIQQSAKYTLAFGPDPCRNKILALFEFWANKLPKEDGGVVSIEASYARICQGLFFEFSRHEISKAIDSLHDDGLITRPDHGHQVIRQKNGVDRKKRRSTGGKDVLTFHVDTINERIRDDAIAGTDGYGFGDWMNLLRKRFPREYHGAAHHPGTFNQCKACTGWPKDNGSDQTDNQGTAYAGSPDNQGTAYAGTSGSNQGTAYPGARAPGALVEAQTSVRRALHKRSKEGKEEETTTSFPFPSSSNTEKPHTVTEAPVQVGAPTPNPRGAAPLPPPAKEPEKELQEGLREVGEQGRAYHPVFVAIMEKFPGLYDPEHDRAAIEAVCDDPTFAANCDTIINKNRYLDWGAMWPFKPTEGTANWRKIHQGKYDLMAKKKGWVAPKSPAPVQSLAQDIDAKPKLPEKTEWERFCLRRTELIGTVQTYRLRDRFPEVWDEWNRRWSVCCGDKEHPNWDDLLWLESKIEPLVAERQVRKHMPDEMRDAQYRGWGEAELMAAFGDVLDRTGVCGW